MDTHNRVPVLATSAGLTANTFVFHFIHNDVDEEVPGSIDALQKTDQKAGQLILGPHSQNWLQRSDHRRTTTTLYKLHHTINSNQSSDDTTVIYRKLAPLLKQLQDIVRIGFYCPLALDDSN